MTNREVFEIIEQLAPKSRAEDWDHVGLMLGSENAETKGILCCLDVTSEVVEEAVGKGANLIVSHHPFIFRPIGEIDVDGAFGKIAERLIKNDITVYSAHTNLDFAEGGVNDTLIRRLGAENIGSDESGMHRFGDIEAMPLSAFFNNSKTKLNAPNSKIVVPEVFSKDSIVKKIGVSCGAFDGEKGWAIENGIDVLVTGELKHHEALLLKDVPFATISAGHYETEVWAAEAVADYLKEKLNESVEISFTEKGNPFSNGI